MNDEPIATPEEVAKLQSIGSSRGVDWHNAVEKQARQQKIYDRARAQRALTMAKRAVERDDWDSYDVWIAQVSHLRIRLED